MALRVNLAPNPALKVNATGWTSNPAGYARSASVDAGLPRATGFEGTIDTDVLTPRAPLTAGLKYVWGVSIKANVAMIGEFIVNYYTALSGGSFVGNSGSVVPFTQSAGTVVRYEVGPYTAPSGAVAGLLKINDLEGNGAFAGQAEVTAYMVEQTQTLGQAYFDGDTAGASWDGANGNSSSTFRTFTDAFTVSELFSKTETPGGPYFTDPMVLGESYSIAATAVLAEPVIFGDGFLVAEMRFDEARGRVRLSAFTFNSSVHQVRVSSRTTRQKFTQVRGGLVAASSGLMARPVDDYEYVPGVTTEYLIEGLNDLGVAVQSATVFRDGSADRAWIKFVANPALNLRIRLTDWSGVSRPSRSGLYDVQGRRDPVIVSDVHGSRRYTINVAALTPAEAERIDDALSRGIPCYVQIPPELALPSIYASVGDYEWARPESASPLSQRAIFTVPLTEVAAPPPSVQGRYATWQTVLDDFVSWEQVYNDVEDWRELADA